MVGLTSVISSVALQASQEELYEHVLNDGLLGTSIWLNIGLAGLTLLLFGFMARNVGDPRSQLIIIAAMSVSAVSIASYTGLASGLTICVHAIHEVPALDAMTTTLSMDA